MKNFIIYLPDYTRSIEMATVALNTGKKFGWEVDLFPGIDGSIFNFSDFSLHINQQNAKCRDMMSRPGVRGCFLSHWRLWNACLEQNTTLGIFEHDIEFTGPRPDVDFMHVLKLEGFLKKKPRPAGGWYEGARAYILKPSGARLLVDWVKTHGALPADVNIGLDIVDIKLDQTNCVKEHMRYGKVDKRENSFTWNLEGMK